MTHEDATHKIKALKECLITLTTTSGNLNLRTAIQELGDSITVGDISHTTGVAIGRNIRQVINQFTLPPEATAALLDLRVLLGTALGLDTDHYQWSTLIADKTHDFVGRDYVFHAIDQFMESYSHGYLTIKGDPGLGKSAILAEYVRRTGCIAHFNMRTLGITSSTQFLQNVCTQLIIDAALSYPSLPVETTRDGAFFLKLLHEVAEKLRPDERLVITVDALDEVDLETHPTGANILFLPPTLPDHVYVVMTCRNIEVPLVAQAPQEVCDLMAHPAENRSDVEHYLHQALGRPALLAWMDRRSLTGAVFVSTLADLSENNFMYLRYVLPEIERERGMYQNLSIERLPLGLERYYEDHWHHMGMMAKPLPRDKIRIVYILCEVHQPVSRTLICEFATDQTHPIDELTVQEVLDEWRQFLHDQQILESAPRYSLYHTSFRDFLHRKDIVQAAGVTIQGIHAIISGDLWGSLFGEDDFLKE